MSDPIEDSARVDHGAPLGDRLRRLAAWADEVPVHARVQLAEAIDHLAVVLGRLVADVEDEPSA